MDDKRDDGAVARERAGHLKHATDLARRLEEVLEQADALKETGFTEVPSRIALAAKIAEEDASAFSGRPHPGRETYFHHRPADRPVIHLFVDESGLARDVRKSKGSGDLFALGAVAISSDALEQYWTHANQLKREFFKGGPDVILHASDLREAIKGSDGRGRQFALNTDKSWPNLVRALEDLVEQTDFTAFGIIIQKWVFHQQFTVLGQDPFLPRETYDLALHLLLERFVSFLASEDDAPIGSIALEHQSPGENARHQLSIAETIAYGTRWISPEPLQLDIQPGVEFLKKQPSHPLELSDILANLLYQLARDEFDQAPRLQQGGSSRLWEAFCRKFYQEDDLRQGKFGLKVFPAGRLDGWLNDFRDKWRRKT